MINEHFLPSHFLRALSCIAVCGSILLSGCNGSPGVNSSLAATGTPSAILASSKPISAKAADDTIHEPFDAIKAMEILKKQCDYGARPLGSPAHEKLKDYLIAQMKLYTDSTITQEFKYRGMPVTNVIGIFNPAHSTEPGQRPILLMTHWDTRPIADGPFSSEIKKGVDFRYGPNGWKPTSPIMGANDAASGVGILLELARMFKQKRPPVGVIILLDDGEDYGDFRADGDKGEGVELGARYFAKHFRENKAFGMPQYGILLDMVGGKDAFFAREDNSQRYAPSVNEKVFGIAKQLGYGDLFRLEETQDVGDDHISINEAGIPTIDIIHPLPYAPHDKNGYVYWHTLQDTTDKCSVSTLKAVGDTVAEVIYREEAAK